MKRVQEQEQKVYRLTCVLLLGYFLQSRYFLNRGNNGFSRQLGFTELFDQVKRIKSSYQSLVLFKFCSYRSGQRLIGSLGLMKRFRLKDKDSKTRFT